MLRTKLQFLAGLVLVVALLGVGALRLYGSTPEPIEAAQKSTPAQPPVPKPEEKPKPEKPGGLVVPAPGGDEIKKKDDKDKGIEHKVGSFSVISLLGSGKVIVKQTGKEAVTIRGDKFLAQQAIVKVQNGTLMLLGGGGFPGIGGNPVPGLGGNPLPGNPIPGAGGQPLPGFPANGLPGGVQVPGFGGNPVPGLGGLLEYHVEVKTLQGLAIHGAGSIDAKQIDTKQLSVNVGGTGDIAIAGTAEMLQLSITGTGSFLGEQLRAKKAIIQHAGFGKANVCVSDQLGVTILGTGSVEYIGSPKVQQNILGLGQVIKKNP